MVSYSLMIQGSIMEVRILRVYYLGGYMVDNALRIIPYKNYIYDFYSKTASVYAIVLKHFCKEVSFFGSAKLIND